MVNWTLILGVGAIIFFVLAIGGGAGYWFFIGSRVKKMTWKAMVYQPGEGVKPGVVSHGKMLWKGRLVDLVPYTRDVVEKIDKKGGATHYWLQKLKKASPCITADCVEVWSQKEKIVRLLLDGDTCTLIKQGYDTKTALGVFSPLPHDRINMIKTEIEERQARITDKKDILTAITPFIVAGICMLALVSIVYITVQGLINISENVEEGLKRTSEASDTLSKNLLRAGGLDILGDDSPIKKEEPPTIPP